MIWRDSSRAQTSRSLTLFEAEFIKEKVFCNVVICRDEANGI